MNRRGFIALSGAALAAGPALAAQCDNAYDNFSVYRDDITGVERSLIAPGKPITVGSTAAMVSLVRAIDYLVRNDIPGDFVECGVYLGGNLVTMITALQYHYKQNRGIWGYDTFAGMPKPTDEDKSSNTGSILAEWEKHNTGSVRGSSWMNASLESVEARVGSLGYPHLRLVKGMVEDTIPAQAPAQIALLRLDTDFYSSTKHDLVHLWPRLSPRGILVIDDYGAMDGCRQACDEYEHENRIGWFLNRVDPHVRLVIK